MIKKSNLIKNIAFALFVFTFYSCGPKNENLDSSQIFAPDSSAPSFLSSWRPNARLSNTATIQVMDQSGRPVANADVLIGQARGNPFQNNFLKTDARGEVKVATRDWATALHITVDAPGYVRQTLLAQKPGQLTIKMNVAQLVQQAKVSGEVQGLPIVNGDKFVDFGLILSSLTRADLFNFDMGSVISPFSDTLSAMGQSFSLPSNTSIPKQKEKYVFNITIEKPIYSYYVPQYGLKQLFSAAGKFEFKPAVDELRDGKPFYELINYFNLSGGSIREVQINSALTTLNFPAQEIAFTKKIVSKSSTLNADEVFLTLAMNEVAGKLIPSSVRKLNSNESTELAVMGTAPVYLVNALKRKSEFMSDAPGSDRISVSLLSYKENVTGIMLPLIEAPQVTFRDNYSITLPTTERPNQLTELALAGALSDVYQRTVDGQSVTTFVRRWEVLAKGWPKQIQLPTWPITKEPSASRQRFEINLIGGWNAPKLELGDDLVESVTHVTRSSLDL